MIFTSEAKANTAQGKILVLFSQYLALIGGYSRGGNFVVNSGRKDGQMVAIDPLVAWSPVIECTEGWAIAHPETRTFEDGTVFSLDLMAPANNQNPDSLYRAEELAKIGISPTPNIFGASYTEAETITPVVVNEPL